MNSGSVDADTATEVRHNVPRSRYEITVDGRVVGFAEYHGRAAHAGINYADELPPVVRAGPQASRARLSTRPNRSSACSTTR